MTATPDPNAAEAERLRAAHELLDERPSPGVRAAVLRAAAESARGSPSADPARVPRARPAHWWLGWRPAAAATVAVGILAVGISVNIERERPAAGSSETSAPATAAPVTPSAPATNAETFSKAREAKPALSSPPAARRAIPEDAPRATKRAFDRSAAPPASAPRAPAGPPAAAPAAGAAQTEESPAPGSAGSASTSGSPGATPVPSPERAERLQAAPAAAPPPRAAAPAAKALLRNQAAPVQSDSDADRLQRSTSPDDWLRRIIELRRARRDAEADDELTRLRAAFPNLKIPADALK